MTTQPPHPSPADRPTTPLEEVEDALLEGGRTITPGTARSALQHRDFRTIYVGAFLSNIGTWMQNVVLGALAYELTGSGIFVGLVIAAQLGPLLLFSMVGGVLADAVDRRKLLISLTLEQAVLSLALAAVVAPADPSRALLLLVVLGIGIGNALYAPAFSAVLPVMVPRRDMPGAISLNSVQMNASRVVGPAIGSLIYAHVGASLVFVLNALSYAAVIWVLTRVALPEPPSTGEQGLHRILEGVRTARASRVLGQCLIVIFVFSLLCLPFITQMPKIASDNLGIAPRSGAYGLLYASFGLGAVLGALSIGTVFAASDKARLTRVGLIGFAGLILTFGLLHAALPAYPVILALGGVYFAVITSLSTVLQQNLADEVRGKVMALWIMGFGGTVPFGGLAGGWVAEHLGIGPLVAISAAAAVALSATFDFQPYPEPEPAVG